MSSLSLWPWLQLFFKERVQDEQGYVLFVRKNALQVLIPKYGLEGTLFLNAAEKGASSLFTYDEEVRAWESTKSLLKLKEVAATDLNLK